MEASFRRRASFCCRTDGCRRRQTPVLLAFLGRRVYVSATVVLVAAMRQGASPARLRTLHSLLGVSRQTVSRWLRWWRQVFPLTAAWRRASAVLPVGIDESALPAALLAALGRWDRDGLGGIPAALRIIAG